MAARQHKVDLKPVLEDMVVRIARDRAAEAAAKAAAAVEAAASIVAPAKKRGRPPASSASESSVPDANGVVRDCSLDCRPLSMTAWLMFTGLVHMSTYQPVNLVHMATYGGHFARMLFAPGQTDHQGG
jgi:hypothetical protein